MEELVHYSLIISYVMLTEVYKLDRDGPFINKNLQANRSIT